MIAVNPTYRLTTPTLNLLKKAAKAELGRIKPTRRIEAVARMLGYGTFAALRSDLHNEPIRSVDGRALVGFFNLPEERCTPIVGHYIMARFATLIVSDLEPLIHRYGYGRYSLKAETIAWAERKAFVDSEFETNRAALHENGAAEEFLRAYAFVSKIEKIKGFNRKRGSYGLKHDAEKRSYRFPDGVELAEPGYVANGMFMIAASYAGFTIFPDPTGGPNARFNISERSRKELLEIN